MDEVTAAVDADFPPKKKPGRPKKKKAAPAPKLDEMAGMTSNDCALACNIKRCVVSGRSYCAHPHKGGLQGRDLGDPKAIGRLQEAKRHIAILAAEKRSA